MNNYSNKIISTYGFAYLFVSEKSISIFLSESFDIDLIKSVLTEQNIDKQIFFAIRETLQNEGLLIKNVINLNDNGYIPNLIKVVNNTTINISIIPKIINLFNSSLLQYDDLQTINLTLLNLDNLLSKFNNNIKKSKIFDRTSGCFNLIEFETDMLILKEILHDLDNNKVFFPKEQRNVFSDCLVGEINLPACRFITEKNILPQHYINKKNNDFISVIYSAIFSKYNERLIKFLENNKDLIKKLFFLINNLISFDYKLNVKKKTIYLEKIWEQFNEKFFAEQFKEVSFQGIKKISSEGKNQLYFGDSDSKIDIIWKNEINFNGKYHYYYNVADCKYKVLDQNGNPKPVDIDKLKRDSDIHNKLLYREKIGEITLNDKIELEKKICSYLIYPNVLDIDISSFKNKKLVLNNKVDYFSEKEKIDFSKNEEYKDINIFKLKVDFIKIEEDFADHF